MKVNTLFGEIEIDAEKLLKGDAWFDISTKIMEQTKDSFYAYLDKDENGNAIIGITSNEEPYFSETLSTVVDNFIKDFRNIDYGMDAETLRGVSAELKKCAARIDEEINQYVDDVDD